MLRQKEEEGLDVREEEEEEVVVAGRVATKVQRVCDYEGKSHLPLTHILQFLLPTKMHQSFSAGKHPQGHAGLKRTFFGTMLIGRDNC